MSYHVSVNKIGAAVLVFIMGVAALAAIAPSASADPYENSTLLGNMAVPRAGAVAGMGLDGKIYVFGGYADSGWGTPVSTVVIFDPTTAETTYGTPMPTGCAVPAIARATNGSFLLIGGYNVTYNVLATVQIYNPVTNSWSSATAMPKGLYWEAACVGADSRVYVFGGRESGGPGNSTLIFDQVSNTWSYGQDLMTSRWGASAVLTSSGSIMLVGGAIGSQAFDLVELYSPRSNSWSYSVNLTMPRAHGGAIAARNGHVYYLGGQNVWQINSGPSNIYSDVERLDLAGGTAWETFAGLHLASFGFCVDAYGRAYVVGGWDGSSLQTTVYMWLFSEISNPYQVVITTPADGSVVSDVVTVHAEIINWMGSGSIWNAYMGADLLVDGVLLESQTSGWSWSFLWDTTALADGSVHTLTVRGYHWDGKIVEASVVVTVSDLSVEKKVAAIEQQLADVQTQLADLQAQLDVQDTNLTAVRAQAAALQAQITALQAQLVAMDSSQTSTLNATLADLQEQLNALQDQLDKVKTTSDSGSMWGMVNMILVIIVIVLLALMFVMGRKGKTPAPPAT